MKFVKVWPLFFATLLTLLILRPILGNLWYPMHDTTHVARLYLMENTIRSGQFPPIWAEGINSGFGYPLFHFYAPLFYYTALLIKQFAGTYLLALKLTLGLVLTLGSLGVMQLTKRWGRGVMLLGSVLFVTSPYLAVDLYVRGAFAELTALCLLPWVIYAWQNIGSRKGQIGAALITTLFVLSHNILPLIAFPFVAIWIIANNIHKLRVLVIPTLLTLLLSSFFVLPLIFERSFVQAEAVAKTSDYRLHFVEPWQIWNSAWGYGGSTLGVEDGLSFKMGKLQLLLLALGTIALFVKKNRSIWLSIFAVFALFMSTSLSTFVWQSSPILALAQFPWRYLAIAVSLIAVVGASSLTLIHSKLLRTLLIIVVLIISLKLNLKYFVPQSTSQSADFDFTGQKYLATVADIIPEYMPIGFDPAIYKGGIKEVSSYPLRVYFNNLDAGADELELVVNRAYYPTWKAEFIEKGTGAKLHAWTERSVGGLLGINVQYGQGEIIIYQGHTFLEYLGYILTSAGIIWSIFLWFKK